MFNETLLELFAKVRSIDSAAADYLESGKWIKDLDGNADSTSGRLDCLFCFEDSPQGFDYWDNISTRLGEWE